MDRHPQAPVKQHLIVLAGVVGSGKSTLSSAWERLVPGWVRVNQDDLGDRRACEHAVRAALRNGLSVLVDRQNFDAQQRRTWLEIATEFPAVEVGGMVMGTNKEECRQRLLVRQDHPTIDNPRLAVDLLDKFSGLWEEPRLDEGYDHLLTLPSLPPASSITPALILSLLASLAATPRNPNAAAQRQPRPRAAPGPPGTYSRGGGERGAFVDDGTWRAPRARTAPGPPHQYPQPHHQYPQQYQQQPYYPQQQHRHQPHEPAPHLRAAFPPSAGHGGAWSIPPHAHAPQRAQGHSWGAPLVPSELELEQRRRAAGAAAQARADAAAGARRGQLQDGGTSVGGAGWAPPPPTVVEQPRAGGVGFEAR
ncbi:hypothetical protein JCM3775_004314 [Rhodotorula graminis]